MSMKIATVEILIEKAHFEPQVAVAVAQAKDEAMEGKVRETPWVTVPILDARLAELKSEIRAELGEIRAELHGKVGELLRHLYGASLSLFGLLVGVVYFLLLHVRPR